jgi:[ribosomal protein S5]-alanine N-acetyltransferase
MAIRMHDTHPGRQAPAIQSSSSEPAVPASDWRRELPTLTGTSVVLRQIRPSDAASLLMFVGSEEVVRYIPPPPATVGAFADVIQAALDRQRQGRSALFAVLPRGTDVAVGIVQVRSLERDFRTAEWGVALGAPYWGRGLFTSAAALMMQFAFETVGVQRLEARSRVDNARANAAFRKIGAVLEGVLRETFEGDGMRYDQCLWSILADERRSTGQQPAGEVPERLFDPEAADVVVH